MLYHNVFIILQDHPYNGDIRESVAGKVWLDDSGYLHVLEDNSGLLRNIPNKSPEEVASFMNSISNSMYTRVVPLEQYKPAEPVGPMGDMHMPVSYHYHRIGMDHPQELAFENGKATLDGHELSDVELARLKENVTAGRATLKRFDYLSKASNDELFGALGHLRNAVASGSLSQDALKTLTRHLFSDTMVPSMGNKKAYEDFQSRPREGVHLHIDLNDFGTINKMHGHDVGDAAIKSAGQAIRQSIDESVGKKNGKAYRVGGDEFRLFVPTHQHAAALVRALKRNWAKVPVVGGTHNISGSIGIGTDHHSAENALVQAKSAKKAANYIPGQAKTHAHSAIPGMEGPLSTD